MTKNVCISLFFLILTICVFGQDSIRFSGQLSSWVIINEGNDLPLWGGVRYIPQINYSIPDAPKGQFDSEFSANIFGSAGLYPFDTISTSCAIKPYRAWIRYSSDQFELRLGLQKLNFGSASILRPLMWFDQLDPRDPLHLTDGVWGVLGRYYFLNNANIWLWGLYGNKDPKGWEVAGTNRRFPEGGGRIQLPVPSGEAALSYHYRIADTREIGILVPAFSEIKENRIGFDVKLDMVIGFWIEGSWVTKNKDLGIFTNQEILNTGIDYTFGIGNGLYVVFEQLIAANDERAFEFQNTTTFTLMSISYPLGLFDNISGIVYYDWKNKSSYNFINWQKQFNNLSLYFMGYWNPEKYNIPAQGSGQNLFAGRGIQLMLVLNH
jgi:hypothetical protein